MFLRFRYIKKEIVRPFDRAFTRNLVDYKYVISLIETNVFISLIENRKILLLEGHINLSKFLNIIISFERITEAISEEKEKKKEADDKTLEKDVVIDKE